VIPDRVRRKVLVRSRGVCEDCGTQARLEIHHLRYTTEPDMYGNTESIRGKETPDDLRALCRDCHFARHIDPSGTFWRDPQEMAEQWAPYFAEMEKA